MEPDLENPTDLTVGHHKNKRRLPQRNEIHAENGAKKCSELMLTSRSDFNR
jgi:hypothetical protein